MQWGTERAAHRTEHPASHSTPTEAPRVPRCMARDGHTPHGLPRGEALPRGNWAVKQERKCQSETDPLGQDGSAVRAP